MTDDAPHIETGSPLWRLLKRAAVLVVGIPVTLVGVVMLITPGPGIPVLLGGLAILAIEFHWPRRQMTRLRETARRAVARTPDGPE